MAAIGTRTWVSRDSTSHELSLSQPRAGPQLFVPAFPPNTQKDGRDNWWYRARMLPTVREYDVLAGLREKIVLGLEGALL
jgi:hypothetical protein